MKRTLLLRRAKLGPNDHEEKGGAAFGAFGFKSARGQDEFAGFSKQSPDARISNMFNPMNRMGREMDEKHGLGKPGQNPNSVSRVVEDFENTDFWRVNHSQELHEHAGAEGIETWIENRKEEIDISSPYKPIPSTHEREDLPPYMHWMVPPKRVRLELKMKEDARRFQKTPEFDLTEHQKRKVQLMFDGLESATAAFPIPVKGSRENFCVTHIECLNWKSHEQWLVCWQLVTNPSERSRYEDLLGSTSSKLLLKWGKLIRDHFGPCQNFTPLMQFKYDDGSIPYKRSVIEDNLIRSARGQAPRPMIGKNKELWGMQPVREHTKANPASSPEHDPVRKFLLEARRELS
eukprot:TRINITY_DN1546_c2_g4_i1.p1 TRINITY_DN1546_c2_g4~~TRINITY_DN1546_c2_g4_i1.p1  ORF type:complete len:366 (+),score=85.66 TRINITY_DN1546_c2_g4_i1:60-1100(+)